ncbi:hypothetical protein B0T19DRAFT_457810 [Cercophora scortea]|uniref:Uncharacterized protein n=1 Tax=Cercophora scortea TaxID=314031 RepID=A0AAE0IX14_9PEZI|nr:hypothetical protein B0T19DRAFT_457810 [Cercophora scortea]
MRIELLEHKAALRVLRVLASIPEVKDRVEKALDEVDAGNELPMLPGSMLGTTRAMREGALPDKGKAKESEFTHPLPAGRPAVESEKATSDAARRVDPASTKREIDICNRCNDLFFVNAQPSDPFQTRVCVGHPGVQKRLFEILAEQGKEPTAAMKADWVGNKWVWTCCLSQSHVRFGACVSPPKGQRHVSANPKDADHPRRL